MSTKPNLFLHTLRYLHALLTSSFILLILFTIINSLIFTNFTVDGHSMDTTLHNGQHLGVSLISYIVTPPKIGDIVIVNYQGDQKVRFVKRIEGVPGDTVLVQGQPIVLTADEYFVEGDNRDHSTDSRAYGPIKRDQIVGKVVIY